jgi:hypothetical protein
LKGEPTGHDSFIEGSIVNNKRSLDYIPSTAGPWLAAAMFAAFWIVILAGV